ncbi:hypothetical protein [Oenococcus sicerae]|uniref:Uncharacterized protein n=1 Tax=Oenococcus sicerae TaxID=2203724 RepID=A0AAJ1R9W7_9LACO|nr:hypothetical protein [Oenococcus sicerae]MDN6900437.1 hypothetical protein [Oenococcus sicerae]
MKKSSKIISGIVIIALLAAGIIYSTTRPAKLSADKTVYKVDGMSANIKGTASQSKSVYYRIDNGKRQTAAVHAGVFTINLAASNQDQRVVIHNHKASATVTVKAAAVLADYTKFASAYNQSVISSNLSKEMQTKAAALQKAAASKTATAAEIAQMTAEQKQQLADQTKALAQTSKEVQAALAKSKTDNQAKLLPENFNNHIKNVVDSKNTVLRINVTHGKLIGITIIVPSKSLSGQGSKNSSSEFAKTFALVANALGANPKSVLKQFSQVAKDAKKSGTTSLKTIRSNNIKFDTGFSTKNLYIYVTK